MIPYVTKVLHNTHTPTHTQVIAGISNYETDTTGQKTVWLNQTGFKQKAAAQPQKMKESKATLTWPVCRTLTVCPHNNHCNQSGVLPLSSISVGVCDQSCFFTKGQNNSEGNKLWLTDSLSSKYVSTRHWNKEEDASCVHTFEYRIFRTISRTRLLVAPAGQRKSLRF